MSAPSSFRVEREHEEEEEQRTLAVPPRPVLPKRHSAEPSRAKVAAVAPGEAVVAVPPRPVLPKKKRATTFTDLSATGNQQQDEVRPPLRFGALKTKSFILGLE
jgi:hypothetical protein